MKVLAIVVALFSFAFVSACSSDAQAPPGASGSGAGTSGAAAPAVTAPIATDPAGRLGAAIARTAGGPYAYTMRTAALSVDGAADPAGPTSTATTSVPLGAATVTVESLFTGGTYLIRLTGVPGVDPRKWLRVDRTRLEGGADPLGAAAVKDPTGLSRLPDLVSSATTADNREYKGSLDLTKGEYLLVGAAAAKGVGDLAHAVPFTATVDAQGYLTSVKVSVPAYGQTKAQEVVVTYSALGRRIQVPSPAASEVIDAPAAAYSLLNGK